MARTALALAAALALVAGGCIGSSSSHSSAHNGLLTAAGPAAGRVVGTLRLVGGPAPGAPRPQPHLAFRLLLGSRVVRRVMTDARGRFSFLLPPGTYELTMGPTTPISPTTLHVTAARITHLPLTIEAR